MKAMSPGKLILSGEHAVVYGTPALALAVDQSVSASLTLTHDGQITITSSGLGRFVMPVAELKSLQSKLDSRFDRFAAGELSVKDVMQNPADLMFYALGLAGVNQSCRIDIDSDIPTGAGMGSSAAVISVLQILIDKMLDRCLSHAEFIDRLKFTERLQHGCGSALDASVIAHGGLVLLQSETLEKPQATLDENWFVWDSGRPASSTGEAVEKVRNTFAESSIWSSFAEVTSQLLDAIVAQKSGAIVQSVRENHRLLQEIGVVPEPVSNMIAEIEGLGGGAKICGAGSVQGNNAGQVLLYLPDESKQSIEKVFSFPLKPLRMAHQGAHLVDN